MDLDSKGLGRLRHVANARDVWISEAGDFTPWLAENLDVLADELGMTLTLVSVEVPVGDFRLDIQATSGDGHSVIIENQLERTDHAHLGQLLTYASGLEAATVVWVAPKFRDDHRRALDWLNERTDTGVEFFGVEITVVQIGETGPRAPVFTVVARPNGWQKNVRENSGGSAAPAQITPLNAQRQDLFAEVLASVNAARPGIRIPARSNANWIAFASGPFGYWSLTALPDGRLRVEAFLDSGDGALNKALFDELAAAAPSWEQRAGVPLTWERLDNKRASRIATYSDPVELTDPKARDRSASGRPTPSSPCTTHSTPRCATEQSSCAPPPLARPTPTLVLTSSPTSTPSRHPQRSTTATRPKGPDSPEPGRNGTGWRRGSWWDPLGVRRAGRPFRRGAVSVDVSRLARDLPVCPILLAW